MNLTDFTAAIEEMGLPVAESMRIIGLAETLDDDQRSELLEAVKHPPADVQEEAGQ